MHRFPGKFAVRLLVAVCAPALAAVLFTQTSLAQTSVRSVKVLPGKDAVEIEVEASDRIVPQTQVLSGPDRLVIDFPNAVPGSELRNQSVNLGEVKDLRFGLLQSKPPVTRIVLDLKTAQSFQVFPYGRTVMIKVIGAAGQTSVASGNDQPAEPTRPGLVIANYTRAVEPIHVDEPKILDVSYRNGLLSIRANKASLSEVLYAVQQRTGAEVSISAGAEQEKVVADLGPAPAAEVLAHLLNGSKFNFLILNAANDPKQLDKVILTPRMEGAAMPLAPMAQNDDSDDDAQTPPQPTPVQRPRPGIGIVPPTNNAPRGDLQPQLPPDTNAPPENTGDPQ
jgi:hypothetical protein